MKHVLVLGAGMVARPLVEHLLAQPDLSVEVADLYPDRARSMVGSHPRGRARGLDLAEDAALGAAVASADLTVSLVPNVHHPRVAGHCLKHRKHLVTASYVGEPMRALDAEARKAGLVFLNEMGLDPGIDHMESMRIIHAIRDRGGKVVEFISYCGGLPAPEADTNPWGYKFSWSPTGVLRAGNSPAQYLRDGKEVVIPADRLFDSCPAIKVEGLPEFEGYPNRDSLQYISLYGIPEALTMLRGTLRYKGWCETIRNVRRLGLTDETPGDWQGLSYEGFLRRCMKAPAGVPTRAALGRSLGLAEDSAVIRKLEWLGLLGPEPVRLERGPAIEVLADLMADRMRYEPGERDLVVLQHRFLASFPDGAKERVTSTLVDFGIPKGDTSMARTVGLPAAIGATLILRGAVSSRGVLIPVVAEIYGPVLAELAKHGIAFKEVRTTISR
jgi:saccharopine dehydrogenase (NADP+, L-glutamate forming)